MQKSAWRLFAQRGCRQPPPGQPWLNRASAPRAKPELRASRAGVTPPLNSLKLASSRRVSENGPSARSWRVCGPSVLVHAMRPKKAPNASAWAVCSVGCGAVTHDDAHRERWVSAVTRSCSQPLMGLPRWRVLQPTVHPASAAPEWVYISGGRAPRSSARGPGRPAGTIAAKTRTISANIPRGGAPCYLPAIGEAQRRFPTTERGGPREGPRGKTIEGRTS